MDGWMDGKNVWYVRRVKISTLEARELGFRLIRILAQGNL